MTRTPLLEVREEDLWRLSDTRLIMLALVVAFLAEGITDHPVQEEMWRRVQETGQGVSHG
jgi:hypothetical protein